MKITLKNIKIIQSIECDLCFTARIYVDGKLAGSAENMGHGGPTDYYFSNPKIREAVETYVDSLPLEKWEFNGQEVSRKLGVDDIIDKLVNDHYNEKEEKKIIKLAEKNKKIFSERGYPFTLEIRLPHQVSWTAVKTEEMVEPARKSLAEKHKVSVDSIKLI